MRNIGHPKVLKKKVDLRAGDRNMRTQCIHTAWVKRVMPRFERFEVTRFCACGQTLKGCQDAEHLVFGSPDESR